MGRSHASRTVAQATPLQVDYRLTDIGQEALGPVRALAGWALSRIEQVEHARARYDAGVVAR